MPVGLSSSYEAVGGEEVTPIDASCEPEPQPCVCVPSQEKAAFRELIAQLELDPKCKGLPLSSFLILPFQRITRLKLLVQVPPLPPPGTRAPGALLPLQAALSRHLRLCQAAGDSAPAPREPHSGG